jgi:hypothetical protein
MLFSRDDLFRAISNSFHHPVVFRVRQALLATESLGFEVCRLLDSPIPPFGSSTMPTHLILLLQLASIRPTLLLDLSQIKLKSNQTNRYFSSTTRTASQGHRHNTLILNSEHPQRWTAVQFAVLRTSTAPAHSAVMAPSPLAEHISGRRSTVGSPRGPFM